MFGKIVYGTAKNAVRVATPSLTRAIRDVKDETTSTNNQTGRFNLSSIGKKKTLSSSIEQKFHNPATSSTLLNTKPN